MTKSEMSGKFSAWLEENYGDGRFLESSSSTDCSPSTSHRSVFVGEICWFTPMPQLSLNEDGVVLEGVRDYAENEPVLLCRHHENGRIVIHASNEGGSNGTNVDLMDLLDWIKKNGLPK